MTDAADTKRPNQKTRTRKDLLQAASRLVRQGRKPSLEEIAEEALVSRATAYRYFPNVNTLLLEASLDIAIPESGDLFDTASPDDPVARMDEVDTALHDVTLANETALRMILMHSLERGIQGKADGEVPVRQNRRIPLIESALGPTRKRIKPATFDVLRKALALIVGPEAIFIFKDVLQLDDAEARKVKRWAIRALVEAATKTASRT